MGILFRFIDHEVGAIHSSTFNRWHIAQNIAKRERNIGMQRTSLRSFNLPLSLQHDRAVFKSSTTRAEFQMKIIDRACFLSEAFTHPAKCKSINTGEIYIAEKYYRCICKLREREAFLPGRSIVNAGCARRCITSESRNLRVYL